MPFSLPPYKTFVQAKLKQIFFVLFLCATSTLFAQQFTISGTVTDSANGEQSIGALVYIKGTNKGISTNLYGFYSLSLEKGTYEIICNYIGYKTYTKKITLDSDFLFDIKLSSSDNTLNEVVISSDKDAQIEQIHSTQMSAINIPIEQIKNIPTIGGETDIIKVMQLMPGVKRGSDGQNTMLVRGGNGDDNLLLLDEAVVYNVSHLFGFFSVFNNDALKDVTMYKGGFPAQYGGRLSSVMDIRMKEGDMQKYHVKGGIGLLSSHLTFEGPIIKDKLSFLVSGRRSYIDQVFKLAYKQNILPYYFYDANYKFNYILNSRDRIYLSGYFGNDILKTQTGSDSSFFQGGFSLGNFTNTLRWNHIYQPKLFSNVSLIYTRFKYDVEANIPGNSFLTKSSIADIGAKVDYNYYPNTENTVKFGAYYTNHLFKPNVVSTSGEVSDFIASRPGQKMFTNDFGVYAGNDWRIDTAFKVNYGARISLLETQGILYGGFEPRVSGSYSLNEKNSVKLGYSRMKQYLHLVSNSAIALPTDLWYPVTKNVKPLSSDQIALSYNTLFKKIKTSLTIETYYKWINNMIEYREGAVLILNDNYENELVKGKGWAYGGEIFLSKTKGKLTGWIGYSLSWSKRKFADLNHGEEYFAKFDRRHDLSLVGGYEFTKRFSVSAVFVYSSGQRFTPVVGNYLVPNSSFTSIDVLPVYGPKNSYSFPSTSRFDINMIFKTKAKEKRRWLKYDGEWHLGAYNLFNRAQPTRVEVVPTDTGYKYQAKGLFGFIPFVAYNFKF